MCSPHDFPKLIRDSGFGFDTVKPKSCINWNDIRVIDIDRLISERDFRTLDGHIPEVINCQLESEFNVQILDNGFIKLFRLSQLSVEYLLQCRRHLDLLTMALKSEIRGLTQEVDFLKKQLSDKENEIMKIQMKFRRRKKNVKNSENTEFASLFKHLTLNTGNYTMLNKTEEGLLTNKCTHCNKIFLNEYYLNCHILRRHPKSIENETNVETNVEVQHNVSLAERLENKIFLEFEHLKERLSTTEKLFRSIENIDLSSSQKKYTEMSNFENLSSTQKQEHEDGNIRIKEDVENKESRRDKMDEQKLELEKSRKLTIENEGSKQDMVYKQKQEPRENIKPVEKVNEQQKDVIEKLQQIINEDQKQNSSQIDELKKQLLQNINSIKEKLYMVEENNKQSEDKQKLMEITTTIKKQADDINILKNMLQEKLSSSITEFKYTIDNQEQLWDKKFKTLEIQHIHTIEDLKSNVLTYLKECQKMQQQYVEKIDSLENKATEHTKVSKVRNKQIENIEHSSGNNITFRLQTNNMENKSEDEVNNENKIKTTSSGTQKNKYKIQIKEVVPNKKDKIDVSNSSDEKSSFSEELTTDLKINQSSKNNGRVNKKFKVKYPMKFSENIIATSTPVKTNAINGLLYNHKLVNEKHDEQIESEDSESLSSSVMSVKNSPKEGTLNIDGRIVTDDIESAEKLLMRKPNMFKAIRNDLNLMLNARLKNMGILVDSKTISSDMYTSCNQTVQNRRLLLKKEYKGYANIRKRLLKMLNYKVNSLIPNKKTSKSSETELKKSSRSTKDNALKINTNSPKIKIGTDSPKTKIDVKNQKNSPKMLNELNHKMSKSKKSSVEVFNQGNELLQTKSKISLPENNKNATYTASDIESSVATYSDTESSDTMKKPSKSEIMREADFNIEVEDLLKSPIKKPLKDNVTEENLQHFVDLNKSSFITDSKKSQNIEGRFSKSETNILQSSDSFSSGSIKLDNFPKKITSNLDRKAVSEGNLNGNIRNTSTKGVLKNVTSSGSLTKKRVNFDLGSNKIKSLSTEDVLNLHLENSNYENSLKIIAVSDSDIHVNKTSKISEIATSLEAQISSRNISNPPAGSINILPYTKNMDATPNLSETTKTLKTDQTISQVKENPTKYKNNTESDIELSDWSDDYSFGTKYS